MDMMWCAFCKLNSDLDAAFIFIMRNVLHRTSGLIQYKDTVLPLKDYKDETVMKDWLID